MAQVEAQCRTCLGTGLTDADGLLSRTEAAICVTCAGTGREIIAFRWFTGRVPADGVALVHSAVFTDTISYAEFAGGAYPGDKKQTEGTDDN
jgi:hypothetical protein